MGDVVKEERLSPKHPDWCWIQLPMEQLLVERSVPFDAKVEYVLKPRYSTLLSKRYSTLRPKGTVHFEAKVQNASTPRLKYA